MSIGNPSLAFHTRATAQMGILRRDAERLQAQLASGERLTRSSDDPVAAARLRGLDRAERLATVDTANAQRAAADLSLAGDALEGIGNDLIRIRELAVYAAGGSVSAEARAAIGLEVAELRNAIIARANARDVSGNALFGGQASGPAYLVSPDGTATYAGTQQAGELPLGESQSVGRGITGPQFLTMQASSGPSDVLAFLKDFGAALHGSGGDPAGAAKTATDVLDTALEAVTRSQTVIGARLQWVETVRNRQVANGEARAQASADAGGVDFAATVARLQQTLTMLDASQTGFARVSALSLFDAI